jgi:hypothetical protein
MLSSIRIGGSLTRRCLVDSGNSKPQELHIPVPERAATPIAMPEGGQQRPGSPRSTNPPHLPPAVRIGPPPQLRGPFLVAIRVDSSNSKPHEPRIIIIIGIMRTIVIPQPFSARADAHVST